MFPLYVEVRDRLGIHPFWLGLVVQACNPRYTEGKTQRILLSRSAWAAGQLQDQTE